MRKAKEQPRQPAPAAEDAANTAPDTPKASPADGDKASDDADTPEPPDKAEEDAAAGEQAGDGETAGDPAESTDSQAEEDGAGDDPREDPAVQPDPAEAAADPENAQLKAELIRARSELAAYRAGVAPDKVADAVTLATAGARAKGDVTEESIAAAMKDVLKRNPEWRQAADKTAGGFRLGSDPDQPAAKKTAAVPGTQKRWNKFNREQ